MRSVMMTTESLLLSFLLAAVPSGLNCGGRGLGAGNAHGDSSVGDEGAGGGTGAGGTKGGQTCRVRAPKNHRAAGSTCPQGRGPGISGLSSPCTPDGSVVTRCWQDSECTDGRNGRCLAALAPMACMSNCTYDGCANDSDCPANQPCDCRSSESDSAANTCVAGNCRVDSDCGPCGFCSPTQIDTLCGCPSTALCDGTAKCYAGQTEVPCSCGDACGHGYFCHTSRDSCIDDSDCDEGDSCNYDTINKMWSCSFCWPIP